jgi:hypothetical protein
MSTILRSPPGILSYPALFSPKPPVEGAEPRYSCLVVFDADALKTDPWRELRQAVKDAATERWGTKTPSNLRWPFRKNEEKEGAPFDAFPDGIFISCWSKKRPGIVDVDRNEILDPEDVWAGQLVRVSLNVWAYPKEGGKDMGNRGVGFGLRNVQVLDSSLPRIDGRASAKSDFDDGTSSGKDDDYDDDIPF